MEFQVRKLWRTVLSTLRTGWSTSAAESAEPKAAASYGLRVAGTKTVEYCAQHAPDGMVNVSREKCRTQGCGKRPSHGVSGAKTVEYCAQHAPDGMVNVCSKKCRTEGCGKRPSYGVAGTKTVAYCAQHAPDGMVNVCSRKCRTEGCGKLRSKSCRYENCGVLCTARTGRDGQRQQGKVQNRRLREETVAWSFRCENCGVL